MTFIWSNTGCIREYVFGMRVHGLTQQGQRPDILMYTEDEAKSTGLNVEQLNHYKNNLLKALKV